MIASGDFCCPSSVPRTYQRSPPSPEYATRKQQGRHDIFTCHFAYKCLPKTSVPTVAPDLSRALTVSRCILVPVCSVSESFRNWWALFPSVGQRHHQLKINNVHRTQEYLLTEHQSFYVRHNSFATNDMNEKRNYLGVGRLNGTKNLKMYIVSMTMKDRRHKQRKRNRKPMWENEMKEVMRFAKKVGVLRNCCERVQKRPSLNKQV